MKAVVLKGFPYSGIDLLERLLCLWTNARFVSLSEYQGEEGVIIRSNADVIKRQAPFFVLCMINHPEKSLRYSLADSNNQIPKKQDFQRSLEFNIKAGKDWGGFYENARKTSNAIIHYDELAARAKGTINRLTKQIPFLEWKDHKYTKSANLSAMRKRHWPNPVTEMPKWYLDELEARYRPLYESLGYDWNK